MPENCPSRGFTAEVGGGAKSRKQFLLLSEWVHGEFCLLESRGGEREGEKRVMFSRRSAPLFAVRVLWFVVVDCHIQRIVLATEETTADASSQPWTYIKCTGCQRHKS